MTDPYDTIYTHCALTLPQNLNDRKKLLSAMEEVLVHKHPAHPVIMAQLAAIELVEKLQSELPLKFTTSKTALIEPS